MQHAGNNYRPAEYTTFMQPGNYEDEIQLRLDGYSGFWENSWNSFQYGYPRAFLEQHWTEQRLGEAANPGPPAALDSTMMSFTGLNVQSLNALIDDGRFLSGHSDVTIFTETAATAFVQQKATKLAQASGRHLCCSNMVSKRIFADGRDCVTKGQASGSAILSKAPLRSLRTPWSDANWASCRVVDTFLVTTCGLIYVAGIYGYHQGFPEADLLNEDLMREVAQRASMVSGPALIIGDLNTDIDSLLAWQLMKDEGWEDAAIWQQRCDGLPLARTFKEESRIDYILVNQQALGAMRSFRVSAQPETDHNSVTAVFDWAILPQWTTGFRMPLEVASLDIGPHELQHAALPPEAEAQLNQALTAEDPQWAWDAFVKTYEAAVADALEAKTGRRPPRPFFARGMGSFRRQCAQEILPPNARRGEFQPTGDETNLLLRQRIRQIRRIFTYVKQVEARDRLEQTSIEWRRAEAASKATWRAILTSSGFGRSFQQWWLDQCRDEFPCHPPTARLAEAMYHVLRHEEMHWRKVAQSHRRTTVSTVFHDDWKKGGAKHFSAIKPPGMPRVDSLDVPSYHHIKVCRARGKRQFVCIPQEDDLQCFRVGSRWGQGQSTALISGIRNGKIYLANVKGTFVTGVVAQYRPSANPHEIIQEAAGYWKQFWNDQKHTDVADDEVRDAISQLPQLGTMDTRITLNELRWALPKLHAKKARGMDGFANFELRNLPVALHGYLVELLNILTRTGRWPHALTKARMALLHKGDTIGDVSMTRPITILASTYRLWAKIMTNKMLKHVRPSLPKTLFGSVPGRCAGDMVAAVQTRLEKAMLQGDTVLGVSLDFSKAYNTLPRELLGVINRRLGLQQLWTPYSSFLQSLERHFTCGKHWGPACVSQVGVPEGCPIAVGQMILLTWTFTMVLRNRANVVLHSYVDDWVVLSSDRHDLKQAILKLQSLAEKFGLILSLEKSGIFATDQAVAKKVRGQWAADGIHIGVVKNFKGLGVNFQTAPQLSAQMRNSRWQSARMLLGRLQYMPWSQKVKTQIIQRGILPHIFYGVQTWAAGKDFVREVRAKCNHAVWGKKMYHLHYLTPAFSGTNYEPMLYIAARRFSAFLRLFARDPQLLQEVWKVAIQQKAFFKGRTRGVVSLFQRQLSEMGWELREDGTCFTLGAWKFSIWKITCQRFMSVVVADWEQCLLQHLRTKQNLADIVSLSVSRSQFPAMADPLQEGFMRKVRLGGLFPYKRKGHVTGEDGLCIYCGHLDTMKHRFFQCPAVDSVRLTQAWMDIRHQPDYILFGGLFPKIPRLEEYLMGLENVGDPTVQLPECKPPRFQLFTDGSAVDNDSDTLRLCSWAVTWAPDAGKRNFTLTSGLLPGRFQSVFRAEFQAVVMAMSITDAADIFCDNQAVVGIVAHLLSFGYVAERWVTHDSRDLVAACARAISERQAGTFTITWTKAHRKFTDATGERDLWLIHHNDAADTAAKLALKSLPPALRTLRDSLAQQLTDDEKLRCKIALTLRSIMDEYP